MGRLTINSTFMVVFTAILAVFGTFAVFTFMKSSKRIELEYHENLRFRSSTFRDAISDSIIMGDYPSVLSKSNTFFSQKDVRALTIKLADSTNLVNYSKESQNDASRNLTTFADDVTINNLGDRASIASVIIKYDPSFLKSVQDDWAIQGVISTIGVLLAAGAAVFLLSNLVNRPIMRLSKIVVRGDLKEISNLRANSRISEIRVLEDSLAVMGRQIIVLNERDAENFRNAAVGKITAQISHDLRAPLNFIERLMHIPDDRMIGEVKQDLKASIFRMNSMIESLRYTDIEAMIKPKQSYIDLSSVLALIKAKADQKSITIVDSLIEARNNSFWIDSSKFERAWINLASNAIDFARSEVRIEMEISGTQLTLRIVDDGPGVSDEFLPKLFQRGATHGKADGTGLGLAYVRQVMQGHGGDVTYRREGGLTIFECHLPNAMETESEEVVENSAVLDLQLVQKLVRTVAICLEPEHLSKSVMAKLTSFKTDEFLFSEEREGANIVVSNIDEIMFDVLEGDEQEFIHVTHNWGNDEAIVAKLRLKFNLD